MRTFEYRGFDASGRRASGLIEALDLKEAREKLAGQGIFPEQVTAAASRLTSRTRYRRRALDLDTRAHVYRELGALLKAGLPLAQAFEVLLATPELGDRRATLAALRDRLREGASMASALRETCPQASPFERAAIEAGERAGDLAGALERLADFLEEQQRIRDRVQNALVYPVVVLCLVLLVAFLMLGVAVPRLAALLEETRMPLPAVTRVTLQAGKVAGLLAPPGILALLLTAAWVRTRRKSDPIFRATTERWVLRLPGWGRGYGVLLNLRYARTLSLLLRGGVNVIEAMDLAGKATGSALTAQLVRQQLEAVRHGTSLAEALRRVPVLARSLPAWVQAGEISGDLAGLLENAARHFQREWERRVAQSLAVLEPALVVTLGGLVLWLALSILLPVLALNRSLR